MFSKEQAPPALVLAHMKPDEVQDLSRLQGGVDLNPKLGIPQFVKLGEILSRPDIRNAISMAFKGYTNADSREREQFAQESDDLAERSLGDEPKLNNEQYESPEIKGLESLGKNGDTDLVLLPEEVLYFLWDQVPEEYRTVNEKTGFPEFGFWSGLLSVIGGVGGFILGSVVPGLGNAWGAAIGAGLGNLGGGYADEWDEPEEKKTPFLSKLLNAGGAGTLGYLGGQFVPGMLGMGGAAGVAGAGSGGIPLLTAGTSGAGGLGAAGAAGAMGEIGSFLKDHGSWLIPAAGLALGQAEDSKNQQQYRHDYKKAHEDYAKQHQYNYDVFNARYHRNLPTYDSNYWKNLEESRTPYKTGGKVSDIKTLKPITSSQYIGGEYDGQADNIHVDVPKGSRVIDADCVSSLGDGNSQAGATKLSEFVDGLRSTTVQNMPMIPCALSSGEYVITPDKVAAIGEGDLDYGHKLLDEFVKRVRAQKKHSVNSIPAPAKDISHYLGKKYKEILKRGA